MKAIKYYLFYTIYGIVVTLGLLYSLFPAENAARYAAYRVSAADPNVTLHIDRVTPNLPPGLAFHSLNAYYKDLYLAEVDRLNVTPALTTWLRNKKEVAFKAFVGDGQIKAKADFFYPLNPHELTVSAELDNIPLERIKAVQSLPVKALRGLLEGRLAYQKSAVEETADAALKITNLSIDLAIPIIKLELLFSSVNTDISLTNQRIEIKQFLAKGEQFDGNLSGAVTLMQPFGQSRLDLTGNIRPHPAFSEGVGKALMTLVLKKKTGAGVYPFRISGTIDNYIFNWI